MTLAMDGCGNGGSEMVVVVRLWLCQCGGSCGGVQVVGYGITVIARHKVL